MGLSLYESEFVLFVKVTDSVRNDNQHKFNK